MDQDNWRVLTVGMGPLLISRLFEPIEKAAGFSFFHLLDPSMDRSALPGGADSRFFFFRDDVRMSIEGVDAALLADLEQAEPTIHNMIMGDRVVRRLPYGKALAWATFLARRTMEVYREVKPAVVVGGYDGVHSGIARAVAHRLGIPWFALGFSTIPPGRAGFCTGMEPGTCFSCLDEPDVVIEQVAERTLAEFEGRRLKVPMYLSANSAAMILRRLPTHVKTLGAAVSRLIGRRVDPYTQYAISWLVRDYMRKRLNLMLLPRTWFLDNPPKSPYLFIGLHMQPESSIDVWAPFYSDQFAVIEAISRSTPPTHRLLVKLHHSDADNYSRAELDRLRSLPGVQLVSPFTSSRAFIENASLVLAIQGNIAMEAALIGKPVLLFGDSRFEEMPSVTKVERVTDLPRQVREKLREFPSSRGEILQGLMAYLRHHAPGCYNDWTKQPSAEEIEALGRHFKALRKKIDAERVSV